MTEEDLLAIAEKLAAQQIAVENFNYLNTPSDIEARVKLADLWKRRSHQ